jgi:hypothetical protein
MNPRARTSCYTLYNDKNCCPLNLRSISVRPYGSARPEAIQRLMVKTWILHPGFCLVLLATVASCIELEADEVSGEPRVQGPVAEGRSSNTTANANNCKCEHHDSPSLLRRA